jgi:hypothetical protein
VTVPHLGEFPDLVERGQSLLGWQGSFGTNQNRTTKFAMIAIAAKANDVIRRFHAVSI